MTRHEAGTPRENGQHFSTLGLRLARTQPPPHPDPARTARGWELCQHSGWHRKDYAHTILVVGPEHARTLGDGGRSKEDLKRRLLETVGVPHRTLKPDEDNGEGTNLRFARQSEPGLDDLIPTFLSVDEIHGVVAGRTGGRFLPGHSRLARDPERLAGRHQADRE